MMPPYGGYPPYPMMFNPMMAMGMGMGFPPHMGPMGMEAGQGAGAGSEGGAPDAETKARKGGKEGDQEQAGDGTAAAARQSSAGEGSIPAADAATASASPGSAAVDAAEAVAGAAAGGVTSAAASTPPREGSQQRTAAGASPTAHSMGTTSMPSMADLMANGKTPRSSGVLGREPPLGMLGGLMMPAPGSDASLDTEKINMYRQHILFLERVLGSMHPQVGKAYVFLARVLQHEGSRWSLTMAQRALLRAWQILAQMKTRLDPEAPASLGDFSYLMGHLQDSQNQHNIAAGMPPAAAGSSLAAAQQKLAASYIAAAAGFNPAAASAGFNPAAVAAAAGLHAAA
jgi:hypothetical protein